VRRRSLTSRRGPVLASSTLAPLTGVVMATLALTAVFVLQGAQVASAQSTTLFVSPTGSDTNACTQSAPCGTIQHAVNVAAAGATVKVAAGTYDQTVNITHPVTLEGARSGGSIINGHGIDTGAIGYYGVVSVQNNTGASGAINISHFTIKGAYETATEYSQDEVASDVSVYGEANAADVITVSHVVLGAVDDTADYGGIGFDTFNDAASVSFTHSTSTGNFQGALLEGGGIGGSVSVDNDNFNGLVACAGNCSGSSTVYPAEGLFVLSDQPGTAVDNFSHNQFHGYAGIGIAATAGYSGGNCEPSASGPCTGNADLSVQHNTFHLGACSSDAPAPGCDAVSLDAQSGNELTANVTHNSGSVQFPDGGIYIQPDAGVYNVTANHNPGLG
jgi:Protein of unknown function (DUF1565)